MIEILAPSIATFLGALVSGCAGFAFWLLAGGGAGVAGAVVLLGLLDARLLRALFEASSRSMRAVCWSGDRSRSGSGPAPRATFWSGRPAARSAS